MHYEIERLKSHENTELQAQNDISQGVARRKTKLDDSKFQPSNARFTQNNSIVKIPDDNLDLEASSSVNKVIYFRQLASD